MAGTKTDLLTAEQKLRLSIQKDVNSICQETTHHVGMDIDNNAVQLIGELVWKKIEVFAADLECFAKHAKRSTVTADDVKLLVRRNPSLLAHITKLAEESSASNIKRTKDKKRKRGTNDVQTIPITATSSKTPQQSTSSYVIPITNDDHNDLDENSDDSPFVKMLHKKINNKASTIQDDEMVDLTDCI